MIRQPFINRARKPWRGYVGDQPRVGAAPHGLLEQDGKHTGNTEATMLVLAERRMVRYRRSDRGDDRTSDRPS